MHDVNAPMAVAPLKPGVTVDDLGEAVLAGLARPIGRKQAWRAFPTFFWGIITFGFGPLLIWQKRFSEFATLEQQQLLHLAKWIGLHGSEHEADELRRDTQRIEPASIFSWLIWIGVVYMGWMFYTWTQQRLGGHLTMQIVMDHTYQYRSWHRYAPSFFIYRTWIFGLVFCYGLHWLHVRSHANAVKQFMLRFNRVLAGHGLPTITPAMPTFLPSIAWWIGGVICVACSAPWGIAMMFAGWDQRQLIRVCSTQNRAQMAWRLRSMMLAEAPASQVPIPIYLQTRCSNTMCQNQVKTRAQYCPRCGQRIMRPAV
jgi:hypothetical protein